jgi:hypothetical protein
MEGGRDIDVVVIVFCIGLLEVGLGQTASTNKYHKSDNSFIIVLWDEVIKKLERFRVDCVLPKLFLGICNSITRPYQLITWHRIHDTIRPFGQQWRSSSFSSCTTPPPVIIWTHLFAKPTTCCTSISRMMFVDAQLHRRANALDVGHQLHEQWTASKIPMAWTHLDDCTQIFEESINIQLESTWLRTLPPLCTCTSPLWCWRSQSSNIYCLPSP